MNKRFLFIFVAIAGLIGVGLVLWYILRPVLPGFRPTDQQPPALPTKVETPFDPSKTAPTPPTSTTPIDPTSPEEKERQAQQALKRQALDFGARQGTYSNADDFDSLRELYAIVTPELRTKLEARREQLRREHPTFGPAWAQTMRTLSAELEVQTLPLEERATAIAYVQAQQITEDARTGKTDTLVRLTITFTKSGATWIPSDVTLTPLAP